MEIHLDSDENPIVNRKSMAEVLPVPPFITRTPFSDVKNVSSARCDMGTTPKQPRRSTHKIRKSKSLGFPQTSSLPTPGLVVSSSSSPERVTKSATDSVSEIQHSSPLSQSLHILGEIDFGAEIDLEDTDQANDGASQPVCGAEIVSQTSPEIDTAEEEPLFGYTVGDEYDHAYCKKDDGICSKSIWQQGQATSTHGPSISPPPIPVVAAKQPILYESESPLLTTACEHLSGNQPNTLVQFSTPRAGWNIMSKKSPVDLSFNESVNSESNPFPIFDFSDSFVDFGDDSLVYPPNLSHLVREIIPYCSGSPFSRDTGNNLNGSRLESAPQSPFFVEGSQVHLNISGLDEDDGEEPHVNTDVQLDGQTCPSHTPTSLNEHVEVDSPCEGAEADLRQNLKKLISELNSLSQAEEEEEIAPSYPSERVTASKSSKQLKATIDAGIEDDRGWFISKYDADIEQDVEESKVGDDMEGEAQGLIGLYSEVDIIEAMHFAEELLGNDGNSATLSKFGGLQSNVSPNTEGHSVQDTSKLTEAYAQVSNVSMNLERNTVTDTSMLADGCTQVNASMNTDSNAIKNISMLTDAYTQLNASMNTDSNAVKDTSMLTDACTQLNVSMNTDSNDVKDTSMLTDACTKMNVSMNTDSNAVKDTSMLTDACTHVDMFTEMEVYTFADVSMLTEACTNVDVCVETDKPEIHDRGILAVADCSHQETMTERCGVNAASAMTPLKLGKNGHRLTAEEVRRQHPRVVANHLDTTMLTNQRLEKENRSLHTSLKEAKSNKHEHDTIVADLKAQLEEAHEKLDKETSMLATERDARWDAEQAAASTTQEMEMRCNDLEKQKIDAENNYAHEVMQLKTAMERNNYQREFASAQQKIRELQSAQEAYSEIFMEMEDSCKLQEHMKEQLTLMANFAKDLVESNLQLKIENENLKKCIVSKEVDIDVVTYRNRELQKDNDTMENLMAQSNQCIEELETILKTSNADINRLQDEMAEQLTKNTALNQAYEELRRSKARVELQLFEHQQQETIAIQALHEAEAQLKDTEDELANEKRILAVGKIHHEEMKATYEENNLKLKMELDHLEKLLDEADTRLGAQEQELYENQEKLFLLQDVEENLKSSKVEIQSGFSGLQDLMLLMEALLDTLNNRLKQKCSTAKRPGIKSSTPKQKREIEKWGKSSLVGEILSHASVDNDDFRNRTHNNSKRQQSNVEFGAICPELGAAAAAMLSPHSQTFCLGSTSSPLDTGDENRKSLSFQECSSRRELFKQPQSKTRSQFVDSTDDCGDFTLAISGFAKIRSIPSTSNDGAELSPDELNSPLAEKIKELEDKFGKVVKAIQLTQRASQLEVKDAHDEITCVKNKLKQERNETKDLQDELDKKEATIVQQKNQQKELQSRISSLTKSVLEFHDQTFKVTQLEQEKKEMKHKIADLEGQCSLLSDHLEAVVKKLDTAMAGHIPPPEAVTTLEMLALKKENHEMMMRLIQQRAHHKELGDKAVNRMKILEANWNKAEAEVKRLDELVEQIREGCIKSRSQTTHPLILEMVRFIDGKVKNLDGYIYDLTTTPHNKTGRSYQQSSAVSSQQRSVGKSVTKASTNCESAAKRNRESNTVKPAHTILQTESIGSQDSHAEAANTRDDQRRNNTISTVAPSAGNLLSKDASQTSSSVTSSTIDVMSSSSSLNSDGVLNRYRDGSKDDKSVRLSMIASRPSMPGNRRSLTTTSTSSHPMPRSGTSFFSLTGSRGVPPPRKSLVFGQTEFAIENEALLRSGRARNLAKVNEDKQEKNYKETIHSDAQVDSSLKHWGDRK